MQLPSHMQLQFGFNQNWDVVPSSERMEANSKLAIGRIRLHYLFVMKIQSLKMLHAKMDRKIDTNPRHAWVFLFWLTSIWLLSNPFRNLDKDVILIIMIVINFYLYNLYRFQNTLKYMIS